MQNSQQPSADSSNTQKEELKETKPQTYSDKINTFMSKEQKQITAEIKQMMSEAQSHRGLNRLQSLGRRSDEIVRKKEHSGDILTKVTIPRSGSFLNAGGLTRYKSKVTRANGQASGGSPLGFNELFNEFRLHEGLHSMDEILGVIIDPDGMSFNDLKPIYKEFLLKLSVTLTKDELYQRSKSIMRRQKKKILRKTKVQTRRLRVGSKFRRLKRALQKNFRWKVNKRSKKQKIELEAIRNKLPESTISSSSYDTGHFAPKEDVQVLRKQNQKRKTQDFRTRRDRLSTSEESDFLSIRRQKVPANGNQNRNSSSGYVSCSDCSYDSDSCTCTSADKCYCSLGNKKLHSKNRCKPKQTGKVSADNCFCVDGTLTFCGCDTDSCAESNKCYCQRPSKSTTLLEQLKQRGFVPPDTQPDKHRKLCKRSSNTRSTKSLEYMHNPCETYYEKLKTLSRPVDPYYNFPSGGRRHAYSESLPLQYDLFANEDFRQYRSIGMFPRNYSEAEHVGLLKQSSSRAYKSTRYGCSRREKTIQASIAASATCNEALSVKKTAEIAALFADMKLSQTTDIKSLYGRSVNPLIGSHNLYNKLKNHGSVPCRSMTYADVKSGGHHGNRMIQNTLYSSSRNFHKASNAKLFNSKNGLYTIQSQSDDSRRSSVRRRSEDCRNYLEGNPNYRDLEGDRNSLENSLGYLP
ncbi:hypothetical protein HHI36_021077 [Cryptolaemus montrouzieri]|uniref:Uncharacterized protein n=1 Tax=Cryptolaemus montrouzieri TaxID=559131 RepID=A0ABD2MVV1_9CUCU